MTDPTEFLRLALDPIRLAVLGEAAVATVDVADLAGRLGVPVHRVERAVGRLRAAGLLDDRLRLDLDGLRAIAAQLPEVAPADDSVLEGSWTPEERKILARFFARDRLSEIPASRTKRLVVLERIAQEFEPGLRYDEREVDRRLQLFHPDHASLRRYLVDEGLMTRADGAYWRSGGRFRP
ncbi:MAG TPA: DUF2087 domain-containing protein [Acidimicrobiia bacterium]|nr:DUF2087 domain-containing protein [Acidimicrobiia bacterium]